MTFLSLLKGKVLAFLTYGLHFSAVWAELGDPGEMGATSGFPFLLAGLPRRTPPPGLMSGSLTPRASVPAAPASPPAHQCCPGTRPPGPPSLASAPRIAAPRAY